MNRYITFHFQVDDQYYIFKLISDQKNKIWYPSDKFRYQIIDPRNNEIIEKGEGFCFKKFSYVKIDNETVYVTRFCENCLQKFNADAYNYFCGR